MRRVLIVGCLVLVALSVFAESDRTVRTAAGTLPTTAGNRYCADLTTGLYIAFARGTSGFNGLIAKGTANGATWTKYVDSALSSGGVASFQLTELDDTLYYSPGQDGVTYAPCKLYYSSATSRDTALPKDGVGAFTTAYPSSGAFNYRGDTLITYSDDSSGTTIVPACTYARWPNDAVTWNTGTRRYLGANAGNGYGFPARDVVVIFTCGSGGMDLFVTNGATVDSVPGGGDLIAPEGNVAANVSFVARTIHDSVVAVNWELNDSSLLRIGKLGGSIYPYTWTWLTAAVRVDSRVSPTGDATAGIRKEGRLGILGTILYTVYKDWRNTANIDSVDICERHIDLSSIPADLTGLSVEVILRHAVDGSLIVEMGTPERYDVTRGLIWEVWRDDAAAGSRTIYAHIDTVTATQPNQARRRRQQLSDLSQSWKSNKIACVLTAGPYLENDPK